MQKHLTARLCNSVYACVFMCGFYMIVKWSGSDTKHSLVNICQSAMHIHTRSFHRIFFVRSALKIFEVF